MLQVNIQSEITAAIREAAIQVSDQLGVQRMIDGITSYPEKIRAQQTAVAECRRTFEDAKAEIEQAKAILFAQVTSEDNGNGKPKYSNKEAREAEVTARMKDDAMCIFARNKLRGAEEDYNAAQFDLQRLDNEFRAHTKAADLVAAQINLLAGLGQ